ncbi:hypothetical protein NPIL_571091 [Nephila pilipes]|uniref:Uncharacterized protein n=1 Tax=Nephila pilipes TaxID=299642 RepID=A0A8X6MB04_NEPPI|nr:hypothetical protein NPIL_571091 [Nephila pilipes]
MVNTEHYCETLQKLRNSLRTKPFVPFRTVILKRVSKFDHNIEHYITTKGQPVNIKAGQFDSNRLQIAKQEFQYMLENDIIRPSDFQER